ncbi:unnamed protein product [Didymodactylos carnosus]|uniref:Uncharacterized protein n=1 Tax=Didymodactylos carnosus TaxID=1234261 RepID=A0A8S2F3V5_9BILA|nr:unnamed protein product [Didymodactylos carnosus]CAF4125039.1 unnamed protein product [Didymodactylos carnosus]
MPSGYGNLTWEYIGPVLATDPKFANKSGYYTALTSGEIVTFNQVPTTYIKSSLKEQHFQLKSFYAASVRHIDLQLTISGHANYTRYPLFNETFVLQPTEKSFIQLNDTTNAFVDKIMFRCDGGREYKPFSNGGAQQFSMDNIRIKFK